MRKFTIPLLAGGGLLALSTAFSPANATLMISADINGVAFSCADQAACDQDATPNVLVTDPGTFGGVEFNGSQQIASYGPPTNTLFTNSFSIHNTNPGAVNVTFAIGATDFVGPVDSFSAAGSGTWLTAEGSTISMQFYGDVNNAQGAELPNDTPGVLLANSGIIIAGPGTDAYDFTSSGAFIDPNAFSWTMTATGSLTPGATANLIGRSQDLTNDVVPVPEPASLAILGGGLLALGAFQWFRRRKQESTGNGFAAA